jgi:hypothetical protein
VIATIGVETMAKKTSKPEINRPSRRKQIVAIKGTDEFKEWIVRFALAERSDMSDLIDDALAAFAKAKGFEPPPRR